MIKTVRAKKVRSDCRDGSGHGDMIPGLDNAYVFDAHDDGEDVNFILHSAVGGDFSLMCHRNMPITIERRT